MGFSVFDFVLVIVYLLVSVVFGAWVGRNQRNMEDYFLGGRQLPWLAVTFSIVATETSVLTFISIPAVAYGGNLTFIQIAFGYILARIVVSLIFIPPYFRGSLQTAYHYLGSRFGLGMRRTASVTFMTTRVLADGVRLFATAIPLALIVKGSGLFAASEDRTFYIISIIVLSFLTMAYTYIGGIRSVVWMDAIQMSIYIGGALLAVVVIIGKLPGGLVSVIEAAGPDNKFQWFDSGFGLAFGTFIAKPYTFFTALVGGAVFGMASHGTDQLIIQRVLTCRTQRDGQKAMIASGIIVTLQFVLFLIIGTLLFAFYGGASPEELGLTRADGLFPKFIVEQMPNGISGLIIAALLAAAMSTLSSSVSSLSSSTVLDIIANLSKRERTDAELLRLSRLVTLLWGGILAMTAILFVGLEGTVVEVALGIASYTYGGLLGAFLLGMINRRASQRDAMLAFILTILLLAVLIRSLQIAWPLFTLIGAVLCILIGSVASVILNPKGSHKM
jgi:SSS family transporter